MKFADNFNKSKKVRRKKKKKSLFTMDKIHFVGLLLLSTIIACCFACSFALGSWIKPTHNKLRQEKKFEERPITLKLSIDKEMGKVLLAESTKNFVEILFGFLTLPMGEIVRLCGKNTGIPPLDNLYASVEVLDEQSFQTTASKNMLLRPRSAYGYNSGLAIDLDQKEPSLFYICSHTGCRDRHGFRLVSSVMGSECLCKRVMEKQICVMAMTAGNTGGFLKDQGKFIISDDLVVLPVTATNTQRLIKREMKNRSSFEVKEITIGTEEVLQILKYSMMSTRPLTKALLRDNDALGTSAVSNRASGPYSVSPLPLLRAFEGRQKTSARGKQCVPIEKIKGNLLMERSTGKIIGLEAREDLADLMFSFLTIPLGSVVKLCGKQDSSLGCLSKLYWSLEQLHVDNFKSQRSKTLLLSPKIAPKHGCKSQLLKIEEEQEPKFDPSYKYMYICYKCFLEKKRCSHVAFERIATLNPKIPGQITEGGRFLKKKGTLIITNDLRVEYLQPALHVCQVNPLDVHIIGIDFDEEKALKTLHYLMTSANVLDNTLHDVVKMPAYYLDN